MRLRRARRDKRSFSRRLIDDEAREFVERELEETRELFRTSSGELHLEGLCRDVFASAVNTDVRWLKGRGIDADSFYGRFARAKLEIGVFGPFQHRSPDKDPIGLAYGFVDAQRFLHYRNCRRLRLLCLQNASPDTLSPSLKRTTGTSRLFPPKLKRIGSSENRAAVARVGTNESNSHRGARSWAC